MKTFPKAIAALMVLLLAVLTGCAGHPVPRENLARAETGIDNARQAGALTDAPVELRRAQEKLDAARAAARNDENQRAARLANEAQVDAELAQQKAISARSQRSLAEIRQGINTLRQELGLPPDA
jgi:hypothetical protein